MYLLELNQKKDNLANSRIKSNQCKDLTYLKLMVSKVICTFLLRLVKKRF